jgi:hypothetical protein
VSILTPCIIIIITVRCPSERRAEELFIAFTGKQRSVPAVIVKNVEVIFAM